MKKLTTFISLLCIINILALGGLFGYLWGTGRLDKSKTQTIADILKAQGTPVDFRTKVYDIMKPEANTQPATSTAPASGPALVKDDVPATAFERNEYVRKAVEAERLRLENEAQDLLNRQETLNRKQKDLQARIDESNAAKKAFDEKVASAGKVKDDAGLQKLLTYFDELKPKQIKDYLTSMTSEEASRYVAAMEPERVAKIITECKTPEDKAFMNGVLDHVRGASPASGTGAASGSGTALSAAANPAVKAVP